MEYENTFVREAKEKNITEPSEILNWYRNLYHAEDNHTEHGIVAYAIDDFFANVIPKSEVEKIFEEIDKLYVVNGAESVSILDYRFHKGITELKKKYAKQGGLPNGN